jgi:hypothetical protein
VSFIDSTSNNTSIHHNQQGVSNTAVGYNVGQSSNIDPKDTQAHFQNIHKLNSFSDIVNYIQQNIINALNGQPETHSIIISLIDNIGQNNPQLASLIYHAADENLRLTVLNPKETGNRRLKVENFEKPLPDHIFKEIALASQGVSGYQSSYFNNNAPFNNQPSTNVLQPPVPQPQEQPYPQQAPVLQADPQPQAQPQPQPQEYLEVEPEQPEQPQIVNPALSLPQGILDYLPKDFDINNLDKTLIIDITTGDEVNPEEFDLTDPNQVVKYEAILKNSVTIYTDGRDGLINQQGTVVTADALVDYITSPYSNDISPEGLEDILDKLTIKQGSDILLLAQDEIYNSDNPADKIKLNNFLTTPSNGKLDKKIKELLTYNVNGGNSGSPNVFLNDVFKNDPTFRLNSFNIDKIASKLSDQLETYLKLKHEDRDPKYLNFITQAIETLSTSHSENVDKGLIATLLQKTLDKVDGSKQEEAKEILSDLSHKAGVTTFSATSLSTGQSLISQFGENIYTDASGKEIVFDATTPPSDAHFKSFQNDIIALITGDPKHTSCLLYTSDAADEEL